MDYSAFDLRSYFTLEEAGKVWCEMTHVTPENEYRLVMICGEMSTAILHGELQAQIPSSITGKVESNREYHGQFTAQDIVGAMITKEDLKAWAIKRGVKPKFLFPEERPPSEKEPSARENQLNKARCQAIGALVWKENPNFTLGDVVKDKRVLDYGENYTEKTLESWIREIDPRNPEQKTGRPKKIFESQS